MCHVPCAKDKVQEHIHYINRVAVTMIFTRCNRLKLNGAQNCSLKIQRERGWWSCNK